MNLCLPGKKLLYLIVIRSVFIFLLLCSYNDLIAQCPPNLDFENGNFTGWTLYTGSVAASNGQNIITLANSGPVTDRHVMLSATPGDGLDPYGSFPKNCPNGSLHSIKLGNDHGGNQAEGASYEFTIPATSNRFSLIYYYAVVIQDPGHEVYQQPRLEIEVLNVTDNSPVGCSSFTFVSDGELPGFHLSPINVNSSPVWYKTWSANSINLDGNAGKTFRIFFKTADCTFISHFGYAYIDVSTECSSSFVGAAFCPGDTAVNVTAPYGYLGYAWYNDDYSQLLGTNQVLHISPPPPSGTNVHIALTPFNGYGCVDTLTASLVDTLSVNAYAGPDKVSCNNSAVQLGGLPVPGLVYKWSPVTGLNDPNISNPTATVTATTTYVLTVHSEGGGCLTTDTVLVRSDILDNSIQVIGDTSYCTASGQNTVLKVHAADSIQWYKDDIAIAGATQTTYNVTETGAYKAVLFSNNGCILSTVVKKISVYPSPVAGFTVNDPIQCFTGNQFIFTDTSSIASGTLEYNWNLGNGATVNTQDITYSYISAGVYNVKLIVKGAGQCIDTKSMTITILPNAIADFSVKPICVDLHVPVINNTIYDGTSVINYLWDFGNGHISNVRDPLYSYPATGTYTIRLTVNTTECTQASTKEFDVIVDAPAAGINYPVQSAIFNYPLQLDARHIGTTVLWTPATNLNNTNIFRPVFKGLTEQLYKIRVTTQSGCVTVDTQLVKTIKKIEIHVPTAFTPDADGNNDFLRPLLYGFKKVNYFKVYNRWGKLFFRMENDQPGWDGKVNNIPQEMQTVIWIIEAVDVDGVIHQEKGSTILMR